MCSFPLSATTTASVATTVGGGVCVCVYRGLLVSPTSPERGHGSAGRPQLMLGLRQKKHCTYDAGAGLWHSDLAGGASQRVDNSKTGM